MQALVDLGLRYPRGPRIKNAGTHVKRYFKPHALWEGDGKQLKISINGEEFSYCWYALIDQNTTLLVGSSLTGFESADSLLQSLKDAKNNVGFMAMGILIDNRLTHEDKVQVKVFCEEHGIVLVNTFPGNSKSNGIIEGNFSIFENQVGAVSVEGHSKEEIAQSVAKNIVEIFTQQRNHKKRKRLNNLTPAEAANDCQRPEHQRSSLEKLRDRLLKQELTIEAKMLLIKDLQNKFEAMSEESITKFREIIKGYSADEIVAAVDRYKAQQAKHPDHFYRSEYFLAILRYKREDNAKAAYNESFRATHKALNQMRQDELKNQDMVHVANKIISFLSVASSKPGTTHLLMSVESLCWGLLDFIPIRQLSELWEQIVRASQRCRDISLKKWQIIAEFIHERIGMFLFQDTQPRALAETARPVEVQI